MNVNSCYECCVIHDNNINVVNSLLECSYNDVM